MVRAQGGNGIEVAADTVPVPVVVAVIPVAGRDVVNAEAVT
jgi:hypothetical protein